MGRTVSQATDRAGGTGTASSLTVLHCVPSLYVGGINRALVASLAALAGGSDRHLVCTLSDRVDLRAEIEAQGVTLVSLGHRSTADAPRTLWRLVRLLRSEGVDVVHAHQFLARAYAGVAGLLARVPVVASVHNVHSKLEIDPSAGQHRARLLGAAQDLVDRATCRRIIAVSQAVADAQFADRPRLRSRVVVIPNGIDGARFAPASASAPARADLDAELGLAPDALVLVNVGRMVADKAQRLLVPIAAQLVEAGHDVQVLVVGAGPESDAVAADAAQAGVSERVHLLGGRDDVAALLGRADQVVVTSVREGFSVAVLEAMAAARPIVASDIPPVAEALRPDVDGVLVPPGDAAAFATAIDALARDPERAAALGASARERVVARFSSAATAGQLRSLYHEVAGR